MCLNYLDFNFLILPPKVNNLNVEGPSCLHYLIRGGELDKVIWRGLHIQIEAFILILIIKFGESV